MGFITAVLVDIPIENNYLITSTTFQNILVFSLVHLHLTITHK